MVGQEKRKKGSTKIGHWKSGNEERRDKTEVQKSQASLSESQVQRDFPLYHKTPQI